MTVVHPLTLANIKTQHQLPHNMAGHTTRNTYKNVTEKYFTQKNAAKSVPEVKSENCFKMGSGANKNIKKPQIEVPRLQKSGFDISLNAALPLLSSPEDSFTKK